MRKEPSKKPASFSRMASFIKNADRRIEEWVHHLISQIDNDNRNQLSRDD
jgi:hypothetical protein